MKEASFWERRGERDVHCFLCAQHCKIAPEERGKCGVRENREGTLFTLSYGKLIARNVDPIGKKPLFHFQPGTLSYSIATMGCNFACTFCQNADISQIPSEDGRIMGRDTPPENIVEDARMQRCASIAYTYTEPTIFMEYALDTMEPAHEAGIKNVFVSNGFMTEQSLEAVIPYLDAANVDLKAFTDEFYKQQCGARLKPVLKTLERMKERGVWLEVTTLLIPGLNDDPGELRELADFIVGLGPEVPWHVSRFRPTYKLMDRPSTPADTIRKARDIGLEAGLLYVYPGNLPGEEGENTFCPKCGELVISRFGFSARRKNLTGDQCGKCGQKIIGVEIDAL
jgi:pyruvate formate lyase activating enzyme